MKEIAYFQWISFLLLHPPAFNFSSKKSLSWCSAKELTPDSRRVGVRPTSWKKVLQQLGASLRFCHNVFSVSFPTAAFMCLEARLRQGHSLWSCLQCVKRDYQLKPGEFHKRDLDRSHTRRNQKSLYCIHKLTQPFWLQWPYPSCQCKYSNNGEKGEEKKMKGRRCVWRGGVFLKAPK